MRRKGGESGGRTIASRGDKGGDEVGKEQDGDDDLKEQDEKR